MHPDRHHGCGPLGNRMEQRPLQAGRSAGPNRGRERAQRHALDAEEIQEVKTRERSGPGVRLVAVPRPGAQHGHRDDDGQQRRQQKTVACPEQPGPERVELLLDSDRPERGGERHERQGDVGDVGQHAEEQGQLAAEHRLFERRPEPGQAEPVWQHEESEQGEGEIERPDAEDAAHVERPDVDRPVFGLFPQQQVRDQESAEDEEEIHPEHAAVIYERQVIPIGQAVDDLHPFDMVDKNQQRGQAAHGVQMGEDTGGRGHRTGRLAASRRRPASSRRAASALSSPRIRVLKSIASLVKPRRSSERQVSSTTWSK